jgi:methanethiol oxidase
VQYRGSHGEYRRHRLADDQSPFVRQFDGRQREKLLYVWTRDASGEAATSSPSSTRSRVGDVRPDRRDAPAGSTGNEAHHFGYTEERDRIFAGGMFSNRMFRYDVGDDPRQLTARAHHRPRELPDTAGRTPRTQYRAACSSR